MQDSALKIAINILIYKKHPAVICLNNNIDTNKNI